MTSEYSPLNGQPLHLLHGLGNTMEEGGRKKKCKELDDVRRTMKCEGHDLVVAFMKSQEL